MNRALVVLLALFAFVGGTVVGGSLASRTVFIDKQPELPDLAATATLDDLPAAPVDVQAETVRLAVGATPAAPAGEPHLVTIREGRVRLTQDGGEPREVGPGGFFVDAGDGSLAVEVIEAARLDVVRLAAAGG